MKLKVIFCLIWGYLIGTLNPAYLFGKLRGMDIRTGGSGNAGATNATLLMGKGVGFVTAFLDIFKAFAACKTAMLFFPGLDSAGVAAGCGCILGHIFPIWMGFAGGKGLACLGGMALACNWKLLCMILVGELILVSFINYICLVAITGSAAFAAVYFFQTGEPVGSALLALVVLVIFIKHIPNLKRIADGSELRIRYLWDKEGETRRVQEKHPDLHL